MTDTSESSYFPTVDEIDALRQGDIEAFKKLYNERFEQMCYYAATIVSNDDASDIVQDVFLTLWNKRNEIVLNSNNDINFYLLKSVRNRAVSTIRKYSTQDKHQSSLKVEAMIDNDVNTEDAANYAIGNIYTDADTSTNKDSDTTERKSEIVRDLIESLPARSREILMLRWYHGLDFEKISIVMGISYSYAHVLHSRAMTRIKSKLGVLPRSSNQESTE